jgi:hypothetical protein
MSILADLSALVVSRLIHETNNIATFTIPHHSTYLSLFMAPLPRCNPVQINSNNNNITIISLIVLMPIVLFKSIQEYCCFSMQGVASYPVVVIFIISHLRLIITSFLGPVTRVVPFLKSDCLRSLPFLLFLSRTLP